MKLELRSKGVRLTKKLENHIRRRVRFALDRFGDRVRVVRVWLTDVNGPKGGADIQCQIRAHLEPKGALVIEDLRDDPFSAVAQASKRIGRRITRHFERLGARRRSRRRMHSRRGYED